MLRAATKQTISNLLDESYFGVSNFTIEYGEGNPLWVKIVFIPNANFYFIVERASLGTVFYQTDAAPGVQLLRPDTHMESTFDACIKGIPDWTCRVKEEVIDSNPLNRELQVVRKQLEERIDALGEDQEDYFSKAEAEHLANRLNEFSLKLDSIAKENAELEITVDGLKKRIEELARATESVNKGTWFRMAGSRFLNTAKAIIGSKEGREFALEAAKKVLLEGPK